MTQKKGLNLFISYSHLDEDYRKDFVKHISPLKNNGLVKEWHDRKIIAGEDFQAEIDNNLEKADIICLFISANFLSSSACQKEKEVALRFRKNKGTAVFPIILSQCGWADDKEISPLQAFPTDGKPINSFQNDDDAFHDIYKGLKGLIEKKVSINNLEINEQFLSFLNDAELLAKSNSQKDRITLDDIFIYPDLDKYDNLGEGRTEESAEKLIKNLYEYSKILIAGENQSGKTTLCKKIFIELKKKGFVPIYLSDKNNQHLGGLASNLLEAYKEQYIQAVSLEEIDKKLIVPIIDNFHLAKHKEKYINDLSYYQHHILIVDDIFSLNFEDENLTSSFTQFKIRPFSPLLRNKLIKKWVQITDKSNINENSLEAYRYIDRIAQLVDETLGIGIVTEFPFFIISIISTHEASNPLEQEITSQGYCYQALIYIYLRKQGVKNEEIEIYINFLTEFAFFFYKEKKSELSIGEFNDFMNQYLEKYNLPIEQEDLINKLHQAQIIKFDSCSNYSFFYDYIYYFFTAKYLSEHLEENKNIIDSIVNNLHKDENAYIAIFVSHHSKNSYILDQTVLTALCLFDKNKPATLSKEELTFFDKRANIIVNAALSSNTTPEKERVKRLEISNKIEQDAKKNRKNNDSKITENNDLEVELRRAIKTVEVMGSIIKNRAGSLEKSRLEEIFSEAVNIYLRILTSFFDIIKNEEGENEIINFILDRISNLIEDNAKKRREKGEKEREWSKDELEKKVRTLYWNTNFFFVYGLLAKIISSLGSNKLIKIIKTVCDKENTPAYSLVEHGISMWYNKNLQTDNILDRISRDDFSETSRKAMKFMIANYCSMHPVIFSEKQKISNKLQIPLENLLEHRNLNKPN